VASQGIDSELCLQGDNIGAKIIIFLKKIDWIIDYYFVYMLYSDNKITDYESYMKKKWLK